MICWSRFLPQSISSLLHLLFSLVDRARLMYLTDKLHYPGRLWKRRSPSPLLLRVLVWLEKNMHCTGNYLSLLDFHAKSPLFKPCQIYAMGKKSWKIVPEKQYFKIFLNFILFSEQSLHKSWADWIQKKSYIYYYTLIRSL